MKKFDHDTLKKLIEFDFKDLISSNNKLANMITKVFKKYYEKYRNSDALISDVAIEEFQVLAGEVLKRAAKPSDKNFKKFAQIFYDVFAIDGGANSQSRITNALDLLRLGGFNDGVCAALVAIELSGMKTPSGKKLTTAISQAFDFSNPNFDTSNNNIKKLGELIAKIQMSFESLSTATGDLLTARKPRPMDVVIA